MILLQRAAAQARSPLFNVSRLRGNMVRPGVISVTLACYRSPWLPRSPFGRRSLGAGISRLSRTRAVVPVLARVHWSGNRVLVGRSSAWWGASGPNRARFANDTLRFSVPPQWRRARRLSVARRVCRRYTGRLGDYSERRPARRSAHRARRSSGAAGQWGREDQALQWDGPRRLHAGAVRTSGMPGGVLTDTQRAAIS